MYLWHLFTVPYPVSDLSSGAAWNLLAGGADELRTLKMGDTLGSAVSSLHVVDCVGQGEVFHNQKTLGYGRDVSHDTSLVGDQRDVRRGRVRGDENADRASKEHAVEHLHHCRELCQEDGDSVVLSQVLLVKDPGGDRQGLQLILKEHFRVNRHCLPDTCSHICFF
jgi:hypothetical protein